MKSFLTSGQVAKKLRISVSTLKRWLDDPGLSISELRNHNGWRLFSESDLEILREFKRELRKQGKRFNDTTLIPVVMKNDDSHRKNRTFSEQSVA